MHFPITSIPSCTESSIFSTVEPMFEYQQTNRFFAQIAGGLEDLGVEELSQLNANNIEPTFRGTHFEADHPSLYRINYNSRYLTRVLAPLITFHCDSPQILYNKGKSINWTALFSVDHTFAIFANVSHRKITHSQYATLWLKDAIVDFFREHSGKRPNIEKINPDV